jgi:pSer/pThr/pTyr-binding forkhead associated (FHA) protein
LFPAGKIGKITANYRKKPINIILRGVSYGKLGVRSRVELAILYNAAYGQENDTIIDEDTFANASLRLIGNAGLPETIPISFNGQPFMIGRYDTSIGENQCDFVFGKATKAVSRRHASIELFPEGYIIVDLNSRAGTYVNGNRIKPEEQFPIERGDRISFGTAGADYVFETTETILDEGEVIK